MFTLRPIPALLTICAVAGRASTTDERWEDILSQAKVGRGWDKPMIIKEISMLSIPTMAQKTSQVCDSQLQTSDRFHPQQN